MSTPADDKIEERLLQSRMVSAEQLHAAREEQGRLARLGEQLSLAEMLVRQGVITDAIRANVEQAVRDSAAPCGMESLGGFAIVKKIGQGGMGTVYLARDPQSDRYVALK